VSECAALTKSVYFDAKRETRVTRCCGSVHLAVRGKLRVVAQSSRQVEASLLRGIVKLRCRSEVGRSCHRARTSQPFLDLRVVRCYLLLK
jgi:hypothetical protein